MRRKTTTWPFASASLILILVTMATTRVQCTASSGSSSSSSSSSFGDDTLTSLVDQDLFLDDSDSGGSGSGPHLTSDLETSGSGLGPDDEDVKVVQESGKKEKGKKEETIGGQPAGIPPTPLPPTSGEKGDVFENKNSPSSANFFSQPGILAAIICGAIVGLLCAILLVMFIVYRMRKKDEGSYVLEDSKRTSSSYGKSKEFFA